VRLSRIRAAGFRGICGVLDVAIPAGFLVVTGRNGTGKTTLCDAIEYALTGTIERYRGRSEAQESLDEYVWWRGDGSADDHFVELELTTDVGETIYVRRDRKSTAAGLDASVLCDVELAPEAWATQMCRTSIIRDDTIASFSLELSESERFQFVQAAMGSTDVDKYNEVLRECEKRIESKRSEAVAAYNSRRDRAVGLREEISTAKASLASQEDVVRAESDLQSILSVTPGATAELLPRARQMVIALRQREHVLVALARMLEERSRAVELVGYDFGARLDASRAALAELELKKATAEAAALDAASEREALAAAQPLLAAMAALARDAEVVGLVDDACPTCRSAITHDQLRSGIEQLRRKVEEQSAAITTATDRLAVLDRELMQIQREVARARSVMARTEADAQTFAADTRKLSELTHAAGLGDTAAVTRDVVDQATSSVRQQMIVLQRAIATLEAHGETSRIAELERLLESVQRDCDDLGAAQVKLENARERVKALSRVVRRVAGEVLEDKLAGLAPLLSDLYLRIRPHSDWRDVQYHLRGDVRGFLSLRVGPDLNPRFMFSSGQRRATGLAFLLSVHLSRTWCRLNTLVLDDPIQHIDDFRALHFVEVLSAIRQTGRQIVCSVEDPDLARLLGRRLRSDFEQEGGIVELSRDDNGETVATTHAVRPMGQVFLLATKTA